MKNKYAMSNTAHPSHLPQVTAPFVFVAENLKDLGVNYKLVNITAGNLKPMQSDVQMDKIDSISKNVDKGFDFEPIYVSDDNHICDGHHRAAGLIQNKGKEAKIKAIKVQRPHSELPHILGRIQDRWELAEEIDKLEKKKEKSQYKFKEVDKLAKTSEEAQRAYVKILDKVAKNLGSNESHAMSVLNKENPVVLVKSGDKLVINQDMLSNYRDIKPVKMNGDSLLQDRFDEEFETYKPKMKSFAEITEEALDFDYDEDKQSTAKDFEEGEKVTKYRIKGPNGVYLIKYASGMYLVVEKYQDEYFGYEEVFYTQGEEAEDMWKDVGEDPKNLMKYLDSAGVQL